MDYISEAIAQKDIDDKSFNQANINFIWFDYGLRCVSAISVNLARRFSA